MRVSKMNTVPSNLEIAYIKSAQSKIATLNKLWDNAVRTNWAPQPVKTLLDLVFRVKGSGGIYGYPALSDAADHLYRLIDDTQSSKVEFLTVNEARRALERQLEVVACKCHEKSRIGALDRYTIVRSATGTVNKEIDLPRHL